MVECQTDADCGVCPGHWLTGYSYVCQRNFSLYDFMEVYEGSTREPTFNNTLNPVTGALVHGAFDPRPGAPGICVDYRLDLNYLCPLEGFAQVTEGLQCFDGAQELLYCGIDVGDPSGDYEGVKIDYLGIIEFPKHIDEATKCYSPFECINICAERRARGDAPPTCTFCSTPCPVNALERIEDVMVAVAHDVGEALSIVTQCVEDGIANCVCAGALMLRPQWLSPQDFRYTPKQKCYRGDPLDLVIGEIRREVFSSIGGGLGSAGGEALTAIGGPFVGALGSVFSGGNPFAAQMISAQAEANMRKECETPGRFGHGSADECYYKRVEAICTDDKLYTKFMQLAESAALRNVTPVEEYQRYERSGYLKGSNVFKHAAGLCRKGVEVNLAQVVEGCVFRMLTGDPTEVGNRGLCSGADADKMTFVLRNAEWDLPKVHWNFAWSDAPPPAAPPGDSLHPLAYIEAYDREYYEQFRAEIGTWYAPVDAVLQNDASRLSEIPQRVNNMQRSRVLLLIRDLDPESLGARVLTAQMTMRWPIACKALHEALNSPERAATRVGSSPYDRVRFFYRTLAHRTVIAMHVFVLTGSWPYCVLTEPATLLGRRPQHFHQPLGRATRPGPPRDAQCDVHGALRVARGAALHATTTDGFGRTRGRHG